MANQEHVNILFQGVDVWNKWRENNPNIKIDLTRADLSNINLSGINLNRADLYEINLSNANLSNAWLDFAGIDYSKLINANLHGAHIEGTVFIGSDLTEADLSNTHSLPGVITNRHGNNAPNFRDAKLIKANLTESSFYGANFAWVDFSHAIIKNASLDNCDFVCAIFEEAILFGSDFTNALMTSTNLQRADLQEVILSSSNLSRSNLAGANLQNANLSSSKMGGCDLTEANLQNANLSGSMMGGCNLTGANLRGANLSVTVLVNVKIHKAILSESSVYGASIWDLEGEIAEQKDIVITPRGESTITVDNVKVAQFIYLILNNEEIKNVINTLTSKTVLILGRFTPERKEILDTLRNELRRYDLLPILFDFDRPVDKDITETIKTLAGLCLFMIADITNPRSSPLELQAIIPDFQIPLVPIIQEGEQPFSMMADLQSKHNWVLDTCSYDSVETLIKTLELGIIEPAMKKHAELRLAKAQTPNVIPLKRFL